MKKVNIDMGDDPIDIENEDTVVIDGKEYTCIDDMGDNSSFILKDPEGSRFLYDAIADDITPYDF